MNILEYLGFKKNTASIAKERLKIILAHEGHRRNKGPDYLPLLQQEIINVIAKYVKIDKEQIKVDVARDNERSVLELNVSLPEEATQ